ncbi:MAG TPA: peptidoglycan-binding domain-containing protein [Stellaceae bacterium]
MKRLLLATSMLALGLGGAAFAQTGAGSAGAGSMGSSGASPSYSAPSNSAGGSTMNDQNVNGSGANGGPMASNDSGNARAGNSSDQVKQAQEALQTQGLYRGQVDGKWGPQTRQAVAQFQKQKGLKQTAQLDQQTMNDLQNGAMSGSDNSSDNMSSSPAQGSSVPNNSYGQGTPGNGPASSGANPGGMNGSDTTVK